MTEVKTIPSVELVDQKNAMLEQNATIARADFSATRNAVTHNQPTVTNIESLLEAGKQQLRASATAQTLSRQESYQDFNQPGETHSNVWWQAQFSMAEAALRNDQPTQLQKEALQNVLQMVIRLTEVESSKAVAEFQDNLLIEFGMRFLSELAAPQIETGETKRFGAIFHKVRSVFTSFRFALERTKLDLDQIKQERVRLIHNAQSMLGILNEKLPALQ